MSDLAAPECYLIADGHQAWGITSLKASSSRLTPVDVADVEGDPAAMDVAARSAMVEIWIGYRGLGHWRVFKGSQSEPGTAAGGRRRLRLADPMAAGRTSRFTRVLRGVGPQELLAPLFAEASLDLVTSNQAAVRRDFTCMGESLLQLAIQARMLWDLDWDLYYRAADGRCYWMPWSESPAATNGPVTRLEYGQNILSHHLNLSGGILETVAMPWIEHSAKVVIVDPRYWTGPKTVRVDRVTHTFDGRKARTALEWSDLPLS